MKNETAIWDFFVKPKNEGKKKTAFCKYCKQSYANNATRMVKHILYKCNKIPSDKKQEAEKLFLKKQKKGVLISSDVEEPESETTLESASSSKMSESLSVSTCQFVGIEF